MVLQEGDQMANCRYCGKEMKIGFDNRRVFCSDECSKAFYGRLKRKNAICDICGKPLTGMQKKYCSDECAKKGFVKVRNEYKKDLYKKPKAEEKPKAKRNRPKKVLSASEIETIARAEGLTYGKCVAKYGF